MDDTETIIQDLRQEVAKWKGRTIEASMEACTICKNYVKPEAIDCQHCRMQEFMMTETWHKPDREPAHPEPKE